MNRIDQPARLLERLPALDRPAGAVRDTVQRILRANQPVKDALHGVWLGHPLHPALAQFALGSLVSASLIDLCGGRRRESTGLIAAGLLATAPTVAAGLADFADGHEEQQRVGVVHAALNGLAASCYVAALLRRRRGRPGDRALSVLGGVIGGISGALGGDLSYRLAMGANHGEEVPHVGPGDWRPVAELDSLPMDRPVRRLVGDVAVFVLRREAAVTVMSDRCPHLSGPLHEGELSTVDGQLRVTCPWHGSVFGVEDGALVHGPATAPVPTFDTRVRAGVVEARVRTLPGVPAS